MISIHALLAESDNILCVVSVQVGGFLSTLSLRRATRRGGLCYLDNIISIHALLAESDRALRQLQSALCHFYPRSPCGERLRSVNSHSSTRRFLSTLSLRRATTWQRGSRITYVISIHALLAESDELNSSWISSIRNFYPRSPCGERPRRTYQQDEKLTFLSTLSLRRATRPAHVN